MNKCCLGFILQRFVSYAVALFDMRSRYVVSEACDVKYLRTRVLSVARVTKVIQFLFTAGLLFQILLEIQNYSELKLTLLV